MTAFPKFLSPLTVGAHTLRNRAVMGSMHTRLEHLDNPLRRQIAFYEARAKGGVGMIVTGGFSPNFAGVMEPGGPEFTREEQVLDHRQLVEAVHRHGAKFLLQILHAGRYATHDGIVGVSASRSPINPRMPRVLSDEEVEATLEDFIRCATLAKAAGYDGVELMGSEGYLINQFTAPRTNNRADRWGGSLHNRMRFPVELVKRTRAALGREFLIMYRISAIDLVEGGSTADEIDSLARAVESAGADMLNTGYGWHEAPVPTIAYQVPRAAWSFGAARLKRVVSIPVMASNRINTPEVAEGLLERGDADLISMARNCSRAIRPCSRPNPSIANGASIRRSPRRAACASPRTRRRRAKSRCCSGVTRRRIGSGNRRAGSSEASSPGAAYASGPAWSTGRSTRAACT